MNLTMTEVVLIRPGCTDFDEQNRIQGDLDLPLSPRGVEQVELLLDQLRDVKLDVIYTAPSEPARATAEFIGTGLGVPVKERKELKNVDQGLWQGLQIDDIRRKFPKVFKQLQESPETICPPQGETLFAALERVRKVLAKPIKKKSPFAVVASEPLATLIGCAIKDRGPELPEPMCGGQRDDLVEKFDSADEPSNDGVHSHAAPDRVNNNGADTEVSGQGETSQ
jgi:broad specificity phosphatase PhoE